MFKETIDSIIRLDLCPLRETKQGNDYYEPKLRELGKVEEKFSRNYNIEFNAPEVSAKVRYYRKLIDNAITTELNDFFSKTNYDLMQLIVISPETKPSHQHGIIDFLILLFGVNQV